MRSSSPSRRPTKVTLEVFELGDQRRRRGPQDGRHAQHRPAWAARQREAARGLRDGHGRRAARPGHDVRLRRQARRRRRRRRHARRPRAARCSARRDPRQRRGRRAAAADLPGRPEAAELRRAARRRRRPAAAARLLPQAARQRARRAGDRRHDRRPFDRGSPDRPHQLFLGGDQIYADDVPVVLLFMLQDAAAALGMAVEQLPVKGGGTKTGAQLHARRARGDRRGGRRLHVRRRRQPPADVRGLRADVRVRVERRAVAGRSRTSRAS